MSTWKGKSRGGVLGYRIFVYFLRHFNISIAYFVLRFVSFYYLLAAPKAVKSIYFYFHKIHGFKPLKSVYNVYQNFYIFGQILIDKVALLSGLNQKYTYHFEGEEYLKQMADGKRGGILIGAHIGNYETAGHLLNRLEYRLRIVVIDEEHQRIKDFISKVVGDKPMGDQVDFIVVKDGISHIVDLYKALNNNNLLTILGDRYMTNSRTVTKIFMGKPALFGVGPFMLAAKYDVPVSFVFTPKENKNHYHFYASPAKVYKNISGTGDEEADLEIIMNDYLCHFEQIVRKYPQQWFNYYDFWKTA